MKLEEAKKILNKFDNRCKGCIDEEFCEGCYIDNEDVKAIETLLHHIEHLQKENEQLRKISKMIESYPIDSSDNTFILIEKREFFNNPYFKNLLDDYISKDKIREKIEEYREQYKNENSEYVKERWGDRILALDDLLRIY